jgi:hypothetical protein
MLQAMMQVFAQAMGASDPATAQWGSGVNVPPGPTDAGNVNLPAAPPPGGNLMAPDPASVMYGGGVNVAPSDAPVDGIYGPPPDPYARFRRPADRPMHPSGQRPPAGSVPRFGRISPRPRPGGYRVGGHY